MPGIPPYEPEPEHERPESTEALGRWLQEYIFAVDDLGELRDDQRQVDRLVRGRPRWDELLDQELADHARSFTPLYRRLFFRHIMISSASGIGIGTVAGVCAEIGEPDLVMTLVAGIGDVDSAAPSLAMWDLGRQVAASPTLSAEFDAGVAGLLDRLHGASTPEARTFLDGMDDFLRRFEARGPNEWELRSHTWGTHPELALSAIDRMRLADPSHSPAGHLAARGSEATEAAEKVRSMLSGASAEVQGQFEAGLRAARLFLAGRERSKTNNIRVVHEMRLALRELGRRLVERGALDNVEQVFMFTDDELDDVIVRPSEFTALAREREEAYLGLFALEPPFVIVGTPPPTSEWKRKDRHDVATIGVGDSLSGIPGCPGVARGRARVILDPSDPTALDPGDILVAPLTDPSWTPLFVPADAVVVDVGAQITHAVIVSRELGIPCVVSVTGGTRSIPDGAMVTVDGTNGTVTLA
jgi:pyruvate,water dikinase